MGVHQRRRGNRGPMIELSERCKRMVEVPPPGFALPGLRGGPLIVTDDGGGVARQVVSRLPAAGIAPPLPPKPPPPAYRGPPPRGPRGAPGPATPAPPPARRPRGRGRSRPA